MCKPSTKCIRRKQVATELLKLAERYLDKTTQKIRLIFHDDLVFAAAEGLCTVRFWVLAKKLGVMLSPSARPSDSVNSLIGVQSSRCPNISVELLSSRIQIKHKLSTAEITKMTKEVRRKAIAPFVENLHRATCQYIDDGFAIQSDLSRWSDPQPIPLADLPRGTLPARLPLPCLPVLPDIAREADDAELAQEIDRSLTWAARYNLQWSKALGRHVAIGSPGDPDDSLFLCAEKVYSVGEMVKATVAEDHSTTTTTTTTTTRLL